MGVTAVRLLSSLGLLVIIVQAQDCSKPAGGPNMDLKGNDILLTAFPEGTKVTFACTTGYASKGGSPYSTCSAGSWSSVQMICERKNCGPAPDVEYGHVEYQPGTEFGDKAVAICNAGYLPVGKGTLTCGVQGWEGRLPTCEVVKCESPPVVVDGSFSPNKETYDYNEVVQYSCKRDYTRNGTEQLHCSDDGTFKPDPPKCVKVECKEPVIPNGFRTSGGGPYGYKFTVALACSPGYSMSGSSRQTCNIDSQWEPGLPECTAQPKPTTPTTTTTTAPSTPRIPPVPESCQDPTSISPQVTVSRRPPYRRLDEVIVSCPSGDEQGRLSVTCGENGLWHPEIPKCDPDSGSGVLKPVLITLAVLAIVAIGLYGMHYFGVPPFNRKKGTRRGNTDKEATKDGEDVALS